MMQVEMEIEKIISTLSVDGRKHRDTFEYKEGWQDAKDGKPQRKPRGLPDSVGHLRYQLGYLEAGR